MVAETLGVPIALEVIADMRSVDAAVYGGNPARKLPTLIRDGASIFGAENCCRVIAEVAGSPGGVVWPEMLRDDVARNTQEMTWHAMSAQVQLVMGTLIGGLPADNVFFVKARTGLEGSLAWLDAHVDEALTALPRDRRSSLLETTLFCLVEHLRFRPSVAVEAYARLNAFCARHGERPDARATPYVFDTV